MDDRTRRGGEVGGAGPIDYRLLAEVAADPIAVHDERGVIVWANRAAAALVGAEGESSLVGQPMVRFVAPELRDEVLARAADLASRGGVMPARDEVFVRLDGTRVAVETSGAALGDGRTLVVVRDVSRRVAAEHGRREAELQLQTFFEASPDAICIARDGRFTSVNSACAALFGYEGPAALVGREVRETVAPSERERVAAFMRHRTGGERAPSHYLTRGRHRDGSEFELEVRATAYGAGDATMLMAILRDVSEQAATEAKLRQSEARFRELFELVPLSLWEVDGSAIRAALDELRAGGVKDVRAYLEAHPEAVGGFMGAMVVVAINAFGRNLVGARTQAELLANLHRIHPPETFPRYRELGLQLAEGRPTARAEGWCGTLQGDRRWIETVATVVPGHEETWGRMLFASLDVTERRRAEADRAALHEQLRQAEKLEAVGRLAGGIAHDFNNILSGILGYAELSLLATSPDSELHDHQQRIREAALRARALVRQILAFGRRDVANRRVVDIPTVVGEALALMRAGIPSTVTFETRLDPAAGAALADPTQIHQIVLNLCANARDAVGPYGHIWVEVDAVPVDDGGDGLRPGDYVRLRVRDDGAGMDDETRARIFEPYMTTKWPFGGHGLGLPVVHGIVAAANGAIRVASAPGCGATFDVYLPRESSLPPPAPRGGSLAGTGTGERILLVDDEPLVRSTHRRVLESLGYRVEEASNGEEALERFRAEPGAFALVLTDQTMPALSGADLARTLLTLQPTLPVILCTGYSDQVDEDTARRIGLRALLQKPMDRETIGAAVRAALAPP